MDAYAGSKKSYVNTQRQEARGTERWLDDQGVKRTFRNEKATAEKLS